MWPRYLWVHWTARPMYHIAPLHRKVPFGTLHTPAVRLGTAHSTIWYRYPSEYHLVLFLSPGAVVTAGVCLSDTPGWKGAIDAAAARSPGRSADPAYVHVLADSSDSS